MKNKRVIAIYVFPSNGGHTEIYDNLNPEYEYLETKEDVFKYLKKDGWEELSIKEISIEYEDNKTIEVDGDEFDNYILDGKNE